MGIDEKRARRGKGRDLPKDVAELSQACANAPKYGLNARALVLETAKQLADEDDFVFPSGKESGGKGTPVADACMTNAEDAQEVDAITDYEGLFEAIPVAEVPFLPYNSRSKIPRFNRQNSMQSLTGKYLALILEELGVHSSEAIDVVRTNETVRRAALAAALAHEEEIYKKAVSKQTYLPAVARSPALKSSIPSDTLRELKAKFEVGDDRSQALKKRKSDEMKEDDTDCAARKRMAVVSMNPDDYEGGIPMKYCFGSSSDNETMETEGNSEEDDDAMECSDKPVQGPSSVISMPWSKCDRWLEEAERQLEEDEDCNQPWNRYLKKPPPPKPGKKTVRKPKPDAPIKQPPKKNPDLRMLSGESLEASAIPSDATGVEGGGLKSGNMQGNDNGNKCGSTVGPGNGSNAESVGRSEVQHKVLAAVPVVKDTQPLKRDEIDAGSAAESNCNQKPEEEGGPVKKPKVKDQLVGFVRALLDPLYTAQVVTREMYKTVVAKVVDKVMVCHENDQNADFLIHEGDKIRRLVEQYIEYCKSKGM